MRSKVLVISLTEKAQNLYLPFFLSLSIEKPLKLITMYFSSEIYQLEWKFIRANMLVNMLLGNIVYVMGWVGRTSLMMKLLICLFSPIYSHRKF